MKVRVEIHKRPEILDPEARTIKSSLHALGHEKIENLQISKVLLLHTSCKDPEEALQVAHEVCQEVLSNPVVEDYSLSLVEN